MRKFEKISFEQFKKDICDDEKLYESYELPKRKTKNAAAYDFNSLVDVTLKPGESYMFATGVKAALEPDDVLLIVVRSSAVKNYTRMVNQIGVIDSDYYNNINNEGHIFIKLRNEGEQDYTINLGTGIAQGMIIKYLTVDDEEEVTTEREGGFGSTNK